MKWIEFNIVTTEDASDAICEMLAQVGADGIAVCDPNEIARFIEDPNSLAYADEGYIESLGTDVKINAYFAEFDDGIRLGMKNSEYENPVGVGEIYGNLATKTVSLEEALQILREKLDFISTFLPVGEGLVGYSYVKDEDWANNWKTNYKQFKISDRITICPSWETPVIEGDMIPVILDPGSAFGTGTHETTSMCAELLDELLTGKEKLLDLGTGSGILAIIASKLGANSVDAIDIDRLAVDVAIENCKQNDCDNIDCYAGELSNAKSNDYDIVVANIIADVICAIASDVPAVMADNGIFICSGIINTKKDKVEASLLDAGFKIIKSKTRNDWYAYMCTK